MGRAAHDAFIRQPSILMRISLLVPCYNEGKSLRKSIRSWLAQSRPLDEIIVVDDCSNDDTAEILKEFEGKITAVRTPFRTGNKSGAQEYGLQFVTGEIFATTDGDSLLDRNFIKRIERDFDDPAVAAVGGHVKSLQHNWLTACRALDYIIGHNIDKVAQECLGYTFVIPGAAGAFRTDIFRRELGFDHDTITEDLDFTYKLHELGRRIKYNYGAVCYTQDPVTMSSYINQLRRWYGGGWQNLRKHFGLPSKSGMTFELSLLYMEGLIYSCLFFALPLLNISYWFLGLVLYALMTLLFAVPAAIDERRWDLIACLPLYVVMRYINSWIYLEQFATQILLNRRTMTWFQPERVQL